MKDGDPKDANVTVSVRLAPTDVAALRAEAARKVRAGERFDLSRLVREQLRAAPWYPRNERGEADGHGGCRE